MIRRRLPIALLLTSFGLIALCAGPDDADAQRRRRRRGGGGAAAYMVQGRVPRNLDTRALTAFGRSHRARRLRETPGGPLPERRWVAKLIVNFGRAIGDVQFDVLYYDVGGRRTLITTQEMFVNDRTQQAFANTVRLRRPMFLPGQEIEAVITLRHREIASTRFELTGERRRANNNLDFTGDGPAP